MPSSEDRLLAFRVGADRFGVPAALVREIGRVPRLTRVPHAPESLLGLGNFRGVVLPVLSFARLMDLPTGSESRVILLDTANPIALAVDDVTALTGSAGVQRIDAEALAVQGMDGAASGRARVAIAARRAAAPVRKEVPLAVFASGGQEFALPLGAVQEILALPPQVARMPHADPVVVGSIAVRGALLPLLSLRALLALPEGPDATRPRIVVVRIGAHRVGLVVDAMRGVIRVPETQIEPVPAVLARGNAETRIQAICRLGDGRRLVSVLAVEHLVREDLTARMLETKDMEIAMDAGNGGDAAEQFLIFRIGDAEFGLPIAAVIEVSALPARLGRLPRTPDYVLGLMNLRGTAVPVIDQSLRFRGAPATGARRRVVVVRIGTLEAGFLVDAVSEVRSISVDRLRPAPELGGEETRIFDRVASDEGEDRMLLIVSPQELLDRAERALLAEIGGKIPALPS